MKNLRLRILKRIRRWPVWILCSLLTLCAMSSPLYATSAENEIWLTPDGSVAMTPLAAADILEKLQTLRLERDILIQSLKNERDATLELIGAVNEYKLQVQAERAASQEAMAAMTKQLKAERRRANRSAIIGAVGVILAIVL